MILFISSFFAGVLTALAPCVVLFLPVILSRGADLKRKPWLMLVSLAFSVILFSILLKSTTLLIDVPASVWSILSGLIIFLFGIVTLWPTLWEVVAMRLGFMTRAQQQLSDASKSSGALGDILVGASLGPIFSACSPTYALIVATILPAEPLQGFVYLLCYVAGLLMILTLIALLGRRLIQKLRWGINPESLFHKILGVCLIVIGVLIMFGLDKIALAALIENGLFDWQINLESVFQTF